MEPDKNQIIKYKSLSQSVKDIDSSKRVVTGYLSAFGNKDFDNDIIVEGAFTKTLEERGGNIFFLNQHNWRQPHGKFAVLKQDSKGLYFESNPLPDTTYSNDALKLYEAGVVAEHSIGYQVIKGDYDSKSDVRTITEVKLYEGSNVTLGANPDTPFLGLKSLSLKEIDDKSEAIIKAVKNGTFTDETFILLEVALKELQAQAFRLGKNNNSLGIDEPRIITQTELQAETISNFVKSL